MPDRDELLRQIGKKVVELCDEDGFSMYVCPACKATYSTDPGRLFDHLDDCPLTRYLEATDE